MRNLIVISILVVNFFSIVVAEEMPKKDSSELNLKLHKDMIHSSPDHQGHMVKKHQSYKTGHYQGHATKNHQDQQTTKHEDKYVIKKDLNKNTSLYNDDVANGHGAILEKKF